MPILVAANYYRSRHYFHENQTPLRVVKHYELELVETGNGFSFLGDQRFPHQPQRLFFARPGMQRFTVGSFACQYIHFDAQGPTEQALLNALPASTLVEGPQIKSMMLELAHLHHLSPEHTYFSRLSVLSALLQEVITQLRPEISEGNKIDPHFSAVISAKEYLDKHFGEKINLEMLAEQAHLSKNFFRTKFCQLMGLSPREYLNQVRLAYAKKLLRTGNLPLSRISELCGYDSQAYFNYVFKQQTDKTPLEYRRFAQKKSASDALSKTP
ncbi:MAG: helix-turn-helix transcriptional regulator [Clostridiales bacterium]|nr:helix-turn-helix transcriptional regulator [Clostridiales bacterium]